jgi:hypothetical protein
LLSFLGQSDYYLLSSENKQSTNPVTSGFYSKRPYFTTILQTTSPLLNHHQPPTITTAMEGPIIEHPTKDSFVDPGTALTYDPTFGLDYVNASPHSPFGVSTLGRECLLFSNH